MNTFNLHKYVLKAFKVVSYPNGRISEELSRIAKREDIDPDLRHSVKRAALLMESLTTHSSSVKYQAAKALFRNIPKLKDPLGSEALLYIVEAVRRLDTLALFESEDETSKDRTL